jgi:phospholipid-binding lipoprotein MlaA
MHRLFASTLIGLLLLTAGCASQPASRATATAVTVVDSRAAVPAVEATAPVAVAAASSPATAQTAASAAAAATPATTPTPGNAVDAIDNDFDAIYGANAAAEDSDAAAFDPWQPMNRRVHAFNNVLDKNFMRPVARGYVKVVPAPMRAGISNVFDNLAAPLAFGNLLLQGRPSQAIETLGRFLVNTIGGIGGIFDPATKALKMHRHSADFGRTLARWGWQHSRYLELPFLGPRTVRDAVGAVGDISMSPMTYVEHDRSRLALEALWLVDVRSKLLPLDELREAAPDEYVLTRDAWLARRRYLVEADRSARDAGNESLPAYLMEPAAEPASAPQPKP